MGRQEGWKVKASGRAREWEIGLNEKKWFQARRRQGYRLRGWQWRTCKGIKKVDLGWVCSMEEVERRRKVDDGVRLCDVFLGANLSKYC